MKKRRNSTTLLELSIQNPRNSMGSISMDQFVLQTIEPLMNIERNEFLNSCSGDKGNDSYTKEGVYVLYGVRQDNKRELLTLETNPTEGATFWGEIHQTLKNRNVEKIDLFIAEDLKEVFNNFDPNSTLAKAKEKVAKFIEKWRVKYTAIKCYFDENTIDYDFTYIKYDPRVRRLIYTALGA